jgi:hypothetical protein
MGPHDYLVKTRLRYYLWQSQVTAVLYPGRLANLIAEAERRGKPEIVENARKCAALLPYVVSRRKDSPVKTGPLRTRSLEELTQTLEAVFKKVSSGQLTLNEAGKIAWLLEGRRRIMESHEMVTGNLTDGIPSATVQRGA